jgi:hypothetical protein
VYASKSQRKDLTVMNLLFLKYKMIIKCETLVIHIFHKELSCGVCKYNIVSSICIYLIMKSIIYYLIYSLLKFVLVITD